MGAALCHARVSTQRSPFYFEEFPAVSEDEEESIPIPRTFENTVVRKVYSPSSTAGFPKKSSVRLSVKHRRSDSEPLIRWNKIARLNVGADTRMQNLKLDTMSQMRTMLSLADSIQESEDYMAQELKRQQKLMKSSNQTLIERTMADLNSIDGFTVVSAEKNSFESEEKSPVPLDQSDPLNFKFKPYRPRRFSGPVILPSHVSRHSLKLKSEIDLLCSKLDRIEINGWNIKEQLEHQEPDLNELDKNIDDVDEKIRYRTDLLYRKLGHLKQ